MSHSRFALGFTRNRKVFGLSDAAFRLYVSAIDWSREQRTDGVLTEKDMPAIPRLPRSWRAVALELTGAGLWHQLDDGWQIHDFLDWQDSADEVAVKQSRARERMRRVRANSERTSGEVRAGVSPLSNSGSSDPSEPDPDPAESFSQPRAPEPKPKKHRKTPETPWPEDYDVTILPRVLEWGEGKGYPKWWVLERVDLMRGKCIETQARTANWFLKTTVWLTNDDKTYGNGPGALEAKRARQPGARPPGYEDYEARRSAAEVERIRQRNALFGTSSPGVQSGVQPLLKLREVPK